MTAFKWALAHLGLKQREAAQYLGVSVPAIEAWSRGTKIGNWTASPPPEAWDKWRVLAMRQRAAAQANDGEPWPAPGAETMPAVLNWIATGNPPIQPSGARRRRSKALNGGYPSGTI